MSTGNGQSQARPNQAVEANNAIFPQLIAKVSGLNEPYIKAVDMLRQWMRSPKAYYPGGKRWIVKIIATARRTIETANPALRLPLPPQQWPPELSQYLNAYTLLVDTLLSFLYLFKDDVGLLQQLRPSLTAAGFDLDARLDKSIREFSAASMTPTNTASDGSASRRSSMPAMTPPNTSMQPIGGSPSSRVGTPTTPSISSQVPVSGTAPQPPPHVRSFSTPTVFPNPSVHFQQSTTTVQSAMGPPPPKPFDTSATNPLDSLLSIANQAPSGLKLRIPGRSTSASQQGLPPALPPNSVSAPPSAAPTPYISGTIHAAPGPAASVSSSVPAPHSPAEAQSQPQTPVSASASGPASAKPKVKKPKKKTVDIFKTDLQEYERVRKRQQSLSGSTATSGQPMASPVNGVHPGSTSAPSTTSKPSSPSLSGVSGANMQGVPSMSSISQPARESTSVPPTMSTSNPQSATASRTNASPVPTMPQSANGRSSAPPAPSIVNPTSAPSIPTRPVTAAPAKGSSLATILAKKKEAEGRMTSMPSPMASSPKPEAILPAVKGFATPPPPPLPIFATEGPSISLGTSDSNAQQVPTSNSTAPEMTPVLNPSKSSPAVSAPPPPAISSKIDPSVIPSEVSSTPRTLNQELPPSPASSTTRSSSSHSSHSPRHTLPPGPRPTSKPDRLLGALIGEAILASPKHSLSSRHIFEYISSAYPYYQPPAGEDSNSKTGSGWQADVRKVLREFPVFAKRVLEKKKGKKKGKTIYSIRDAGLRAFENGGFDESIAKEAIPDETQSNGVDATSVQHHEMASDAAQTYAADSMDVDTNPGPSTQGSQPSPTSTKLKLRIKKPQHLIVSSGGEGSQSFAVDVSSKVASSSGVVSTSMDTAAVNEGLSSGHEAMEVDERVGTDDKVLEVSAQVTGEPGARREAGNKSGELQTQAAMDVDEPNGFSKSARASPAPNLPASGLSEVIRAASREPSLKDTIQDVQDVGTTQASPHLEQIHQSNEKGSSSMIPTDARTSGQSAAQPSDTDLQSHQRQPSTAQSASSREGSVPMSISSSSPLHPSRKRTRSLSTTQDSDERSLRMKSDVLDTETALNPPRMLNSFAGPKMNPSSSALSVKTNGVKHDDRSATPPDTSFSPSTYSFLSYAKEAFMKSDYDRKSDVLLPAGMWPYGVQAGAPLPSSFDFDFVLHDEEWALMQQWNEKYYTTGDVSKSICLSLGCYSAAEAQKAQKQDPTLTLSDMLTRIQPKPWPAGRLVYAQVNDGGSWLVTSLPDIIFDNRVEISRLVKLGSNRVTIKHTEDMSEFLFVLHAHFPTQSQLVELEHERAKDAQWDTLARQVMSQVRVPKFSDLAVKKA